MVQIDSWGWELEQGMTGMGNTRFCLDGNVVAGLCLTQQHDREHRILPVKVAVVWTHLVTSMSMVLTRIVGGR